MILNISWKSEKGKPEGQRIVRLWNCQNPEKDSISVKVDNGAKEVTIKKDHVDIPEGKYLIHLDVENQWMQNVPFFPPRESLNTIEIYIDSYKEIPQKIFITSVIDEKGKTYEFDKNNRYKILVEGKIIGKRLPVKVDNRNVIVKKINEGWFVGKLSVNSVEGLGNEIELINPVKFEYNFEDSCIEAVEDKEGDGLYFCPLCKKFFCDNNHYTKEIDKGHKPYLLMGNIKLRI